MARTLSLTTTPTAWLQVIGVASYVYDGHGRRVKNARIMGDDYSFYDKAGRLVYREKHDGTKVKYAFLAKLQVARIENGTTTKYVHTELLGSPVVESDSTGSVLEATRMHYRPFGQTKETPKDEVGFTGHMFDTDIGLVYAQQRYYDSEIGRFYADDPVQYTGQNPVMSFNRYLYTNNNPYKYTDPDGRFFFPVLAVVLVNVAISATASAGVSVVSDLISTGSVDWAKAGDALVSGAKWGLVPAANAARTTYKVGKAAKDIANATAKGTPGKKAVRNGLKKVQQGNAKAEKLGLPTTPTTGVEAMKKALNPKDLSFSAGTGGFAAGVGKEADKLDDEKIKRSQQ